MSELVQNPLTFAVLQIKWEDLKRDESCYVLNLRLRRALSWLGRAEKEITTDFDASFIFYWIAFNATYAKAGQAELKTGERRFFGEYFQRVVALDSDNMIYNVVWERFSGPVRVLLDNKFVYEPFWKHHNGVAGYEDWADKFERSKRKAHSALGRMNVCSVLEVLFDRLYVLRNQLLHGGATWNGSVNRNQVRDGAHIMAFLAPHFINLMMDNPNEDWGAPHYPVIDR